jgi:ribosomal protein S18 acetylase RimI-like enzyme
MLIRRLLPADAAAFLALRLAALRECPSAFSSSYEEECDTPLAEIEQRFAPGGRNLFGAFDGEALVGMAGAGRETSLKTRHKGYIRSVYVAPSHRGTGLGKRLFEHALAFACAQEGVRQVQLVVSAGNQPAIALYQGLGFKVYGHEPRALLVDGVYHDDLHMVRECAGSAS